MKNINQLKAGAILSYISLGLSSFISILYTPTMLNLLGQAEYGLYNLSNSIVGYLGVLSFGLSNSVVRYASKYIGLKDRESEENLYGIFTLVYSILAIIVLLVGSILISNFNQLFSNALTIEEVIKMKVLLTISVCNLAISFAFGVFGGIIHAYERFIFPKVVDIVKTILGPMIMIPLLLLGYKSVAMIMVATVINIISISINVYYCFRIIKVKIRFKKMDFSILSSIANYSFFIFLNIIINKLYWSTDQLILGAVSGTIAVAVYSIASQFQTYYMSFSTAISGVFLPKITKMVAENTSDKEISDLFIRTGRVQYIIMSLIISGFILIGRDFIYVWAGPEYSESFYIALVVMIPLTIPLIQNVGITILQAKNMHRFRSVVYTFIAVINVIATIPLAKHFGGIGAAVSTAVSMIIGNIIIINIYYYKKVNIDIPRFWREIIVMTIPVAISLICGVFINNFINLNGYLSLIIKGSIFVAIFSMFMWFLAMNDYEKVLFSKPLKTLKCRIFKK